MNKLLRGCVYILIFLLPFGPRFSSWVGNISTPTVFSVFVLYLWFFKKMFEKRLPKDALGLPIFMFVMVCLFSMVLSMGRLMHESSDLFRACQFLVYILLYFVARDIFKDKKQIERVFAFFFIISFLEGLIAVIHLRHPIGFIDKFYSLDNDYFPSYLVGTFTGEHNSLAAYMLFPMMFCVSLVADGTGGFRKMAVPALVPLVYIIIFSYSRTAYLAFFFGLAVILFIDRGIILKAKRFLYAILVAYLLIYIVLHLPAFQDAVQRAMTIYNIILNEQACISWYERVSLWRVSFKEIFSSSYSALLGHGLFAVECVDNFFLSILYEAGIVGAAVFVFLIFQILKNMYSKYFLMEEGFIKQMLRGFIALVVVEMVIFNLASDNMRVYRVMGNFWIFLGLFSAYCAQRRAPEHSKDGPEKCIN